MVLYRNDGALAVAPSGPQGELYLQFWPSDEGIGNPDNRDQFLSAVAEALERIRGVNVIETVRHRQRPQSAGGYNIELSPGTRDLFLDRLQQFAVSLGFRFYSIDTGRGAGYVRFLGSTFSSKAMTPIRETFDDFSFISIPTLHHPIAPCDADARACGLRRRGQKKSPALRSSNAIRIIGRSRAPDPIRVADRKRSRRHPASGQYKRCGASHVPLSHGPRE